MLKEERQRIIMERLLKDGQVLATEVSANLGISEDTIRRDLRELAEAGRLQRVHGGAMPVPPPMPRYDIRRTVSSPARTAIAKAAAKLARNGQVIFMDSGTTMLEVARYLPERLTATVVTTSPPVAVALADHPSVSVIMVGGRLDKTSMIASGAETVQALSRIRADLCFLGVCSLHPVIGVSEENYDESLVKRAMITHSAEVAALASAEKLGNAQPFVVAPIKDLTYLVTDMAAPEETLAAFRAAGITILQS